MSANIINCHYRFGMDHFKGISFEAKELIKHLLLSNPGDRISATQCLQSSWISQVCIIFEVSTLKSIGFNTSKSFQARKFTTPLPKSRLEPYLMSKTVENGLRRYTQIN